MSFKMKPHMLPSWPRLLSVNLAAAYVGVSETQFEKEVGQGVYPRPLRSGVRKLWDRHQIDAAVDQRIVCEGIVEDAAEVIDPILEKLHEKAQSIRARDQQHKAHP